MSDRRHEDAERVMGHLFASFAEAVHQGHVTHWRECGHRAHVHEVWTKRSAIRDEIVALLIALCAVTPGMTHKRHGNATYFYLLGEFKLKINKLSDFLKPNINGTDESVGFLTQQSDQYGLFVVGGKSDDDNYDEPIYLGLTTCYLGYVPTENDPLNPQAYLVCFDEAKRLAWHIPLNRDEPLKEAIELQPTAGDHSEGGSPEPRRVRVKRIGERKGVENE